jgi:hypothetical protein
MCLSANQSQTSRTECFQWAASRPHYVEAQSHNTRQSPSQLFVIPNRAPSPVRNLLLLVWSGHSCPLPLTLLLIFNLKKHR